MVTGETSVRRYRSTMVEKTKLKTPSAYGERLAQAMSLGPQKMTAVELADSLGITRQAVDKVLKGGSSEMSASNNARAAQRMNVDPTWLATGEGLARPSEFQARWDERLLIEQFRELTDDDREEIAGMLRARLELNRSHRGSPSADPFAGTPLPPTVKARNAKKRSL